ncbi:pilus assembly protein CpaE [Tessaracoccus antarcticus]|uniref:Pilus assembly protein CpaE n=1 Tax=Tessaracoccus antarcticus TaxID=2479848 RepID=A0A3M0G9E7_9ACTN|nr:pilus assembly protein CpaE [Tessaracoccus antarcticus]RMB58203.1 pilus assembly protein CpaE [Tessaracoccus antarcticus]
MIDMSLALALREAGLQWEPEAGDRFTVTAPEMAGDIFHLADMVIEARRLETGTIFAFNGTTEWALDSVDQDKTVWLPGESHLRVALGPAFRALERGDEGFVVTIDHPAGEHTFADEDVENAYGNALLAVLTGGSPTG